MTTQDLHLHDPQTLYRHWEDGQWNPFAIDLGADREQWQIMSGEDRELVHWALASLMVVEERITTKFAGTLGLTAFRFITRYLEQQGLLPGFIDGYRHIHHDEQRHIGYGVWYLRQAVRDEPALAEEVRSTLRELLPAVAESLTPPDREGTDWEGLGASAEEIREFALGGLTRRLKIVGVPLDTP